MRALTIAATGMSAQETNVEVISNNIANLNTTAFKRQRADFNDLLYQSAGSGVGFQVDTTGLLSPVGSLVGLGTKVAGIYRNNTQGVLLQTDNELDVAIQGKGYFQVNDGDGNIFYTRSGALQRSADGTLVNIQGFPLEPAITIPDGAREVEINPKGEVLVKLTNDTNQTNLGRIQLSTFINEGGLSSEGNNLYAETESSGTPVSSSPGEPGYGNLQKGFLEASNVDSVKEITNLITAQRAYELNSKVISTADEMLSSANNIK
jgi:flagellar basal-body rod protein FlgG